jgi:uncharacterized protein (TIGR02266 family)
MSDRQHQRIPYSVRVEFRTVSSFLVTYSINLSRGGIFLETDQNTPVGNLITLHFAVPGIGAITLEGRVTWSRPSGDPEGPAGIGVEFDDIAGDIGHMIDTMVEQFEGLSVLLLSGDPKDRASLKRLIRSIMATADVVSAADPHVAETLLTDEIDLAVIDTHSQPDGCIGIIKAARGVSPPVPTVALAGTKKLHQRAIAAGADEVGSNPPQFAELQKLIVRALGRPSKIA